MSILIVDTNSIATVSFSVNSFSYALGMIWATVNRFDIKYICFAFDNKKKSHRHLLLPSYKANRAPLNQEQQENTKQRYQYISTLKEIMIELGYPVFDAPEGDDACGTLGLLYAKKYKQPVYLLSGDQDLMQLVSNAHGIKLLYFGGRFRTLKAFDDYGVFEKYNVLPTQIPFYKALAGDSSDGYHGIKGVGPQHAQRIVEAFGTVDNFIKDASENGCSYGTPKMKESIVANLTYFNLCYQVAVIRTDIPYENVELCEINASKIIELHLTLLSRINKEELKGTDVIDPVEHLIHDRDTLVF